MHVFVRNDCDNEITPEMIEAGATILLGFDTFFEDERSWAVRVYRTMRAAARTEPGLED
jgi:hypothetical protein